MAYFGPDQDELMKMLLRQQQPQIGGAGTDLQPPPPAPKGQLSPVELLEIQEARDQSPAGMDSIMSAETPTWGTALAKTIAAGFVGQKGRKTGEEKATKLSKSLQTLADKAAEKEHSALIRKNFDKDREFELNVRKQDWAENKPTADPKKMTPYQQAVIDAKLREEKREHPEGASEDQQNLSSLLVQIQGNYRDLKEMGATIDVSQSPFHNVWNWAMAKTGVETPLGTNAGALRDKIEAIRPLLINAIRQASEMGARGMDSQRELDFYLAAATDTSRGMAANMAAIATLNDFYGIGALPEGEDDPLAYAREYDSDRDALKDEFKKVEDDLSINDLGDKIKAENPTWTQTQILEEIRKMRAVK